MVKVYVASAFTSCNLGGNKAGVVLFENNLSVENKKYIAKKLGYAETAFITNSDKADYKIEYFTPKEEVSLCGHATIASFGVLNYLKKLNKEKYSIETKSGILEINIKDEKIYMEQNIPTFYETIEAVLIKNSFDIDCISLKYPIQIVSTGLKDILIPISDLDKLNTLKPKFDIITDISRKYDVVGMHLYVISKNKVFCRNFAPLYDVYEEAATGTSNCALAGFMFKKLNIKRNIYVFNQGYSLNSPSIINVKIISSDNENIDKIYVGGESTFIEEKLIELCR